MVLYLLRLLVGYVSFTARGGFPERFINLCRQNRIDLWNLKSKDSVLFACTDSYGYKKIRSCARKSGMKLKISKKHGLPFFLHRHSRRIGILVGAVFCIAVFMLLSTRIWRIDVVGNERVPTERILEVFGDMGVKIGTPIESVTEWSVEQGAASAIPEILWVNINLMGTSAQIEVMETVENKEHKESDTPANIVASRDGQIVYLRPFRGSQEKKIGTGVAKGDLLISGTVELADLSTDICRADGYVVARTLHKVDASVSTKITVSSEEEQRKSYAAEILTFRVPLGKQIDGFEEKSSLFVNGAILPFAFCKTTVSGYVEKEEVLEKEEALLMARLEYSEKCAEEFRYMKIEDAKINEKITENGCEITGEFTVLENIGKIQPIEVATQ